MSAFAIFATVLTIGYIIYFGFIISRDIIANKKAEKSEVETFEVEPVEQPQPTAVCETAVGFAIAPKVIEEENVAFDLPLPCEETEIDTSDESGETKAQTIVASVSDEMEPMDEASEPGFTPADMDSLIKNSLADAMGTGPKIVCEVIDETHGQPVSETSDENAEHNDSEEEIRL